ncbi:MAG: thioredoxin family protein [Ignavibacteria bacterium]|nr:thioredoxin family protein [Ignavibacteria bacterium]
MFKLRYFALFFLLGAVTLSQSNFDDALKKAKTENKRVIVDVYTDWCGWCKKMDEDVYSNNDIKKIIDDNFIFVKLNAEGDGKLTYNGKQYTEEELSYFFEVFSFPTTVFLEPDGKIITFSYDKYPMKSVPGYFKAKEFKKILEYFKDGKYKDTDLSTTV